jgi:hypothetical protein
MAYSDYYDTVQEVYLAYYGRTADLDGLAYWSARLEQVDGALGEIIEAFASSEEAQERYGNLSDTDKITAIYQSLYERDPDPEGLAFYRDQLEQGEMTQASIMLNVLDGSTGSDLARINGMVESAMSGLDAGRLQLAASEYAVDFARTEGVESAEWQTPEGIGYRYLEPTSTVQSDLGPVRAVIPVTEGIRSWGGLDENPGDLRFFPGEHVTGDVDNDGDTDIIYANAFVGEGVKSQLVLLENVDGIYVEHVLDSAPSVGAVSGLMLTDLNNDQVPDLIVADNSENNDLGGGPLHTLLQDPEDKFNFTEAEVFPTQVWQPGFLYEEDFNGDGVSDYFIDSTMWDGTEEHQGNTLVTAPSLFLTSSDGYADHSDTFPRWNETGAFKNSGQRLFDDFDGDGDIDAIFLKELYEGGHWFYENRGDGHFEYSHEIDTDLSFFSEDNVLVEAADVADVDGDGNLDFVTYLHNQKDEHPRNENQISVHFGDGEGNFSETILWNELNPEAGRYPTSLALEDLDGNGRIDIFASSFEDYDRDDLASTFVFNNQGDRQFSIDSGSYALPAWADLMEIDGQSYIGFTGWHYANGPMPAAADFFLLDLDDMPRGNVAQDEILLNVQPSDDAWIFG